MPAKEGFCLKSFSDLLAVFILTNPQDVVLACFGMSLECRLSSKVHITLPARVRTLVPVLVVLLALFGRGKDPAIAVNVGTCESEPFLFIWALDPDVVAFRHSVRRLDVERHDRRSVFTGRHGRTG
jgi:hypothetical protein